MTREQLQKAWPILEAFKDGKKIEALDLSSSEYWYPVPEINTIYLFEYPERYRIKPTPKLRPWKPEEALGQKVRMKDGSIKHLWTISFVTEDGQFAGTTPPGDDGYNFPGWYLDNCETIDGKPCGVEE